MSDKKKLAIEAGLLLSGAALGAAGAIIIEPIVIVAGIAAAGVGAIMRYNDRHILEAKESANYTSIAHK